MKIENILLAVILAFAIFGLIFVVTIVHEYGHKKDVSLFSERGEYCLIDIPDNNQSIFQLLFASGIGAYVSTYDKKLTEEMNLDIDNIMFKSELKAYAITIIISALFTFCIIYFLNKYIRKEEME